MRLFSTIIFLFSMVVISWAANQVNPKVTGKCMTCHKEKSPGLYKQWYSSAHAEHDVTCISCHGGQKSEVDAFMHEGALIATLVTPKDSGQ